MQTIHVLVYYALNKYLDFEFRTSEIKIDCQICGIISVNDVYIKQFKQVQTCLKGKFPPNNNVDWVGRKQF